MKNRNVFWGVLLILGALLIIGNEYNIFFVGVAARRVILAVIFGVILIRGLVTRSYGLVFVSLVVLIKFLGELTVGNDISLLSAAVIAGLLSIGLSLIFPKKKNATFIGFNGTVGGGCTDNNFQNNSNMFGNVVDEMTGSNIYYNNKFAESTKYVRTSNLVNAKLENCFGELKVYFDNATIIQENVVIDVSCIFGEVQVFVPRQWNVQQNISAVFADVKEVYKGQPMAELPRVNIVGSVTFGEVQIIYI